MAAREWGRTEAIRPNVRVDSFVIMPNHLHGLLVISRAVDKAIEEIVNDGHFVSGGHEAAPVRSPSGTVGA